MDQRQRDCGIQFYSYLCVSRTLSESMNAGARRGGDLEQGGERASMVGRDVCISDHWHTGQNLRVASDEGPKGGGEGLHPLLNLCGVIGQ